VTDVSGLVAPERIFGDIRGVVPNPLESASDEDEIHVTRHELRPRAGSLNELFTEVIG
jgi:hypothetical protein